MKKKPLKIILIIIFSIILSCIVLFNSPSSLQKAPYKTPTSNIENNISFTLVAGNTSIKLDAENGSTLYENLNIVKVSSEIKLAGKNYPHLGFFVTSIGTLHSSDGKYLIYFINGKEASVGVSSYILKNGDMIEWKLK